MRDIITKDFGWKLFSLALAVVIWATVKTVSSEAPKETGPLGVWETRTFTNLSVLVVSDAADVREFRVNPDFVDVKVSGSPEIMAALDEKQIHPAVNLTEITATSGVSVRVDVFALPGITVVRVVPSEVNVVVPPKKN